jgi:hypothetical protein
MRPHRPIDPTACWWCGWPDADIQLGGEPLHAMNEKRRAARQGTILLACDEECCASIELFVELEEIDGR